MIVDTSALAAIVFDKPGASTLIDALLEETALLPAPALTEFQRVAALRGAGFAEIASDLMVRLFATGLDVIAYDRRHAAVAAVAGERYGKGNGRGGKLNLLDLIVYAVAQERDDALLFTGRDFAATDVRVHRACRIDYPWTSPAAVPWLSPRHQPVGVQDRERIGAQPARQSSEQNTPCVIPAGAQQGNAGLGPRMTCKMI